MNSGGYRLRYLIVYGPTQEPLDPVRYLTNRSTGTMGRLLADAAEKRGHKVTRVECPTHVRTARELLKKLQGLIGQQDVLIMAAAVCDVRPAAYTGSKIKKSQLSVVKFVKNPDILKELSIKKSKSQIFVGFALESIKLYQGAHNKLRSKKLDLIVAQKVSKNIDPFGNKPLDALLITATGHRQAHPRISKASLAQIVIRKSESLALENPSENA